MPLYRDEAVVLRVHKLGEADRIVTLLTRRFGRVRAVGKGVRRTTSKFGASLEPGSHIDVQFHSRHDPDDVLITNRGLDIVTQAESLGSYGARLAGDYPRWTAASAICETAERLTEEGEPALRLYLLVIGALRALVERVHDSTLVLDAFFIRAMSTAGWEPALRDCAKCGEPGPHAAFNVPAGGIEPSAASHGGAHDRPVGRRLGRRRCERARGTTRGEWAHRSAPAMASRTGPAGASVGGPWRRDAHRGARRAARRRIE